MKRKQIGITSPRDIQDRLRRSATLQHLLEVYRDPDDDKVHEVPIWEEWLSRSGELPPDFDALPSQAGLPYLLTCLDGSRVESARSWPQRRAEILDILRYYALGDWPEPLAWTAQEIDVTQDEKLGCTRRRIDLILGPTQEAVEKLAYTGPASYQVAYLKVEVAIPHGGGSRPVLVGPDFRRYAGQPGSWRVPDPDRYRTLGIYDRALGRGYATCTFSHHDAFACRNVFTGSDCTEFVWWAWGICRCIDFLHTVDEIDDTRIAVAGHSRGGKTALHAAAMDERIAAAVVSHTGAGKVYRYAGERFGSQTLEVRTRLFPHMSHPRLRFFCGRENKLPFDGHFLLSLVAPRALLITEGDHDPVGELLSVQEAFQATKQVYALLGQPDRLNTAIDPGGHTLSDAAMERWLDWLDLQFGRRAGRFEDQFVYDYTFDRWQELTQEQVDVEAFPERDLDDLLVNADGTPVVDPQGWQTKRDEIVERLLWVVGDLPAYERPSPPVLQRQQVYDRYFGFRTEGGLVTERMALDEKLVCYLTYRAEHAAQSTRAGPLPVAIYCHQYNAQRGFAWQRHEQAGINVGERLAYKGFLAVEYDQFGYGTRNRDSSLEFFVSHPERSALGVMVQDVRRIVDVLSLVPAADADRIALVGYALGGAVALHTAALDARIRAVASVCGFASMRLDAHGAATEGLGRYCRIRPLLPRLGFFCGHERRVPYDYHELLALIAPRPALIYAPSLDQDWFPEDVVACYEAARHVYRMLGAEERLALRRPYDFNRYPPRYQDEVNDWLWAEVHERDRRTM